VHCTHNQSPTPARPRSTNWPILPRDACSSGEGFFAGSGGDGTAMGALLQAGWVATRPEASYYYVMRAPGGDKITYVEGDIFRSDVARRTGD
jgi:hypothetical protein